MNYPVWYVPFGPEWLIVAIAVVHVFISHFAVGGGLFLVAGEARTRRHYDPALVEWLRRFTKFFLLLTLVMGAVTGVGIWFTIGLISPEATSTLIHSFVWVWAIEWVFFFVEILSIIVYAYTWDSMPKAAHRVVGWIYFIAAYLSLVAIDGILSFMLTPGKWLQSHALFNGFFNPSYLPSLVARSLICVMLGGLFALLVLSFSKDRILKAEMGRYASVWVVLPALGLPLVMYWLLRTVPAPQRLLFKVNPIVENFTWVMVAASGLLVILAFLLVWLKPRSLNTYVVLPLMVLAFAALGAAEWVREDIREPYLITDYLYINQIPVKQVDAIREKGMLASSPWVSEKEITPANEAKAGEELFRMACSICHVPRKGFNALGPRLTGLDHAFVTALVSKTDLMRAGMPPFVGKPEEAAAVARYLMDNAPKEPVPNDGKAVWNRRCGECHTISGPFRPVADAFAGQKAEDIAGTIASIEMMNDQMPRWTGNDVERTALALYLSEACKAPAKGGAK